MFEPRLVWQKQLHTRKAAFGKVLSLVMAHIPAKPATWCKTAALPKDGAVLLSEDNAFKKFL